MGHERLGLLPKSKKWRTIVEQIGSSADTPSGVPNLLAATAREIESCFTSLGLDPAVQRTFTVLVALTIAARSKNPEATLASLGFQLNGTPDPFNVGRLLHEQVRGLGKSPEYAEIARASAVEAVSAFYERQTRQGALFDDVTDYDVWRSAATGSGFCELARQYFACLTACHFEYILEREASASLPTLKAREDFQHKVRDHIDEISRHSFETSKIAQSFAAGWYNKYATNALPTTAQFRSFLRIATRKIKSSLLGESAA